VKKLLFTLWLLLLGSSLYAQNTVVSATVVDSDSTAWANGTWTMTLIPGPSQPNPNAYTVGGVPVSQSVINQNGVMDGSGNLSITVYQTVAMAPSGSSWLLSVCPLASVPCSSYNFISVGSTQNISTALTAAIKAPRFIATPSAYGYSDTEAQLQLVPGATYWNVSTTTQRCYNNVASTWGACNAGGAAGVSSFNTRTGAVTLNASDVDAVGAITNSTSGNSATSTSATSAAALSSTPTNCGAGVAATGVAANGNAVGCFTPSGSGSVSGQVQNVVPLGGSSATAITAASNLKENPTTGNMYMTAGGLSWNSCQLTSNNGSVTINLDTGNCQYITASGGNLAVTFTNADALAGAYLFRFCSDGTLRTITFPGGNVNGYSPPVKPSECINELFVYNAATGDFDNLGSTVAGLGRGTAIANPGTPLTGQFFCWLDSTAFTFQCTSNSGTSTTVFGASSATSGQVEQYIDQSGVQHYTAVVLTSMVSGILPVANGGSGSASPSLIGGTNVTITGSWPNQTVTASGSGGAPVFPISAQTGNYSVVSADFSNCRVLTYGSSSSTVTLLGTAPSAGQCLWVINYGTGTITVARNGLNINGAASNLSLTAGTSTNPTGAFIDTDGSNYFAQVFGEVNSTSGVAEIIPGTNVTCSTNVGGSCTGNVTVNASSSGTGTVTDGSGTSTANEPAVSTTTTHQIQYLTSAGGGVELFNTSSFEGTSTSTMPNQLVNEAFVPVAATSDTQTSAASGTVYFANCSSTNPCKIPAYSLQKNADGSPKIIVIDFMMNYVVGSVTANGDFTFLACTTNSVTSPSTGCGGTQTTLLTTIAGGLDSTVSTTNTGNLRLTCQAPNAGSSSATINCTLDTPRAGTAVSNSTGIITLNTTVDQYISLGLTWTAAGTGANTVTVMGVHDYYIN
jgi:hypothetical protein